MFRRHLNFCIRDSITILLFIYNLNIFPYFKIDIGINETFLIWLIINIALVINRIQIKEFIKKLQFKGEKVNKVAIYGAGQAGCQLAASIKQGSNYSIKFFIDDDPQLWNRKIFNRLTKLNLNSEVFKN